ncbi:MAG: hypothetical protein KC561_03980, partial [Myxococcales bacterium]|nr:hypothetical protein [Myxococcales bacterium]
STPDFSDSARWFDYAVAARHDVPENLIHAAPILDRAIDEASGRDLAALTALRGEILGTLGRTDEALDELQVAGTMVDGEEAALWFRRGAVLAQVWRWTDAETAFSEATRLAPNSQQAWAELARARSALFEDRAALDAARSGLLLQPRHASLLLSQLTALRSLGADAALIERSLAAYEAFRENDRSSDVRLNCFREVEGCSNARLPVPRFVLHSVQEN